MDLLTKKQEKAKRNKSLQRLYGSIGLFMSLLMVVFMFNWKSYESKEVELLAIDETVEDLLDIPVTEQPPPPPPKNNVQQPSIVEVPDEEEIIEEALRVLKMAEPWNPGEQRGKPVRVRMVLPIHFVYKDR